ncbi:MAG: hypothetical protein JW765_12430 [Deltaproteobacteria bacterium]|nr:hypothetical protein [Candidatus Zymogenaceae bacterium]
MKNNKGMPNDKNGKNNEDKQDYLNHLYQAVFWHDSVLQSYRGIFITLESIFVAIAILLFTSLLENKTTGIKEWIEFVIYYLIIVIIYCSNNKIMNSMEVIFSERSEGLAFFAENIRREENGLPCEKRYYTEFRKMVKSKGSGNTISTIFNDNIFKYLRPIWWIIIVVSSLKLFYSILSTICPELRSCIDSIII